MKKLLVFLALATLLSTPARAETDAPPPVSAASMILLHGPSGRVLAEKNADERRLIASTTKLMTALAAVKAAEPEREIRIQSEWTRVEGSSMYLRPGERYTLLELLQGLLLASGNDAALAIANAVDGDTETFVARMNRLAEELGLKDSHFSNPHGLDGADHRSTARDMARLMAAAMEEPRLGELLGTKSCSVHGQTYVNHNKLLWLCPGVNGGKTGYTMAAGRCLVTSCRREGLELICVTLSDPADWEDHAALYDWAFARYGAFTLSAERALAHVPVLSGERQEAPVAPRESVSLCLGRTERVSLCLCLPPFVFSPVRRAETAGHAFVLRDGERVCRMELVWGESVEAVPAPREEPGAWSRFLGLCYRGGEIRDATAKVYGRGGGVLPA